MNLDAFDVAALVAEHGTPLYLYDMDAAIANVSRLRARLPERVDVYYAMKANSNRRVVELFKDHVAGLDLSSAGEMALALPLGYDPAAMSFAGPGKTERELEHALAAGLGLLSLESPTELARAEKVAASLGIRARATLRINPQSIPKAFPMKMGGRPSQFGVAEEDVDAPLRAALASDHIDLVGFHVYSGTQCLDADAIVDNIRLILDLCGRLCDEYDVTPQVLNLGGGFGVAYFPGQEPVDGDAVADRIGDVVADASAARPRLANARFILELGRFLIGPYGAYVTRVVDVKHTRGKRFAILDGGMHHCFPATGNFGQLIKKNYPVHNLTRPDAGAVSHELVGPLCTPLDSMARSLALPAADIDDLVCFTNTGAYSFSASPLLFLSHDTPPELVRYRGAIEVARARKPATAFT